MPVFGWRDVGVADIAWALLLSALGVTSITGLTNSTNDGGRRCRLGRFVADRPGCAGQASAGGDRRRTGGGGRFELGSV